MKWKNFILQRFRSGIQKQKYAPQMNIKCKRMRLNVKIDDIDKKSVGKEIEWQRENIQSLTHRIEFVWKHA